jgi:hypothetical protein
MRFLPGPALAMSLAPAWPVASAASAVEGTWCSGSEMMHIDAYGIGFNEHTVCEVENLPVTLNDTGRWISAVACRNVRITGYDGAGNVQTHEQPIDRLTEVSLRAVENSLILSTNDRQEEISYEPCA